MSSSTKPKGHGHQVSVADAAMLFGSASDDPFASLVGGPEPGLGGIDEEAEEKLDAATTAGAVPPLGAASAAIDDGSMATPKAHTSALPEGATESLGPPASSSENQVSLASSPSALFASSTTNDFFSGNHGGDDWLGQNGEVQHDAAADLYGHQDTQHAVDYKRYGNGTEEYAQYQAEGALFDEQQQQPVHGYGSEYLNGTYQQHTQDPVAQYSQYDQPSAHYERQPEHQYDTSYQPQEQGYGQYEQYSTEQQQGYDPAAYSYGQQGYDETNGAYQHDPTHHAEQQYNQYDPAYGQSESYSQQHEASFGLYDSASHPQEPFDATSHQYDQATVQPHYANDAPSEQYVAYNDEQQHQQQTYDPALYGQGKGGVLEKSAEYPLYDQVRQGEIHQAADHPSYEETAQEERQADFGDETTQGEEHQYTTTTNAAYDYSAQQEEVPEGYPATHASALEDSLSPHTAPYAAGPYDALSDGNNYRVNPYTLPAQEEYSASDSFTADDTIQQHEPQGYADWSGADNMPRDSSYHPDIYPAEREGLHGDGSYDQTAASSGYFDNLAVPSVIQHEDEAQSSRSLDVVSPYDPRFASAGFSSLGESAYMAQDRTMDAAEEKHRAKIPLVSFSIDGKLLTFFPTWSQDASDDAYAAGGGGYGMGGSAAPTKVTIRTLRSVIPPTSYASSKNPLDFPGPALEGETNQGSALSRATGASASTSKAKKSAMIKYLDDAATDMASGISYLSAGKQASEARRIRDRILILRLLVIVLENDGNIVSNAAFDLAAKELLLADQDGTPVDEMTSSDLDRSPIPGSSANQKAHFLNQMEGLLMAGQRKEAVDLAVKEKMWTHAVVIASGMDRTTWREVVGRFVRDEFDQNATGHQGLKVAYHLFSGQEPKTTYDLFRSKNSTQSEEDSVSANLSQWRKSVATILANRSNGDSATLTAIGDGLAVSGWVEAAHICYLLSPQTSPMEGYDGASTRLTLLGANSPEASTLFMRDLDHIILTEVFEYALSLQPVAKGAESYHGLAYLQSYRLVHAYLLAEMGEVKRAMRYCDSIMTLLKHGKMNRYYHPVLLNQLQELSNRLQGDTKSTSWTKKKPTMDGVWSALEGRFTKFIAGEEGSSMNSTSRGGKGAAEATIGPFSHYSAITPEARAGGMSRVHSTGDFRNSHQMALTVSRPQSRPGSALSLQPPNPRSVSEYGYNSSTLSSPKHSIGRDSSDADMYGGNFVTHSTAAAPWYGQETTNCEDVRAQNISPVDPNYYGYEPHGASHPQFISNVDQDLSSAMGRASIDERRDYSADTSSRAVDSYQPTNHEADEEDDDLGFGNKSTRGNQSNANGNPEGYQDTQQNKEVVTPEKKKEGELKPASSWFALPKLWGRSGSSEAGGETKAKKAHLGEEVSFYYDKDLGRWINKRAGDTGAAASPPPPPPRAQTASPSSMGPKIASTAPDAGPRRVLSEMRPPPSSSSSGSSLNTLGRDTPPIAEAGEAAMCGDSDYSPTKSSTAGRSRSNLADGPAALQPGPPLRPGGLDGPPRTASTSSAKKKPINKRYVAIT